MRITNKIIQNNSLTNINTNKTLQDQLSTMISSKKKISRPSEDPIVALRSLRLRTSVNQTEQYVEKNVEDAKSWLSVTEDSIDTLSGVIDNVRSLYTKGTNDPLTPSDRRIITENLEALVSEIYATGNADFAGRSVFTGFRTSETLTFQKQEDVEYAIKENEESVTIDTYTHITRADVETDVSVNKITRVRLSYEKLDDVAPLSLSINGKTIDPGDIVKVSIADDPYGEATKAGNEGKAIYVPETGEILLGSDFGAVEDVTSVEVEYQKTKWSRGDLRPEHYFTCTTEKGQDSEVKYNFPKRETQEIQYNIGVNQSLRINTNASECFNHSIARDIQDSLRALSESEEIEATIKDIEKQIAALPESDVAGKKALNDKLDAAKKAQTFINDKLHQHFSKSISKSDDYLAKNSVALTNCGTRSKRLELIENRLDTQLFTLKELKSENEDADIAETAIKLSSANYAYDAALMATGKIMKESLLNYI